jgi:hypothetical protein
LWLWTSTKSNCWTNTTTLIARQQNVARKDG